jgi:hypothetical protein
MQAENFAQILQNTPHCSQFMSLPAFEPNKNFKNVLFWVITQWVVVG